MVGFGAAPALIVYSGRCATRWALGLDLGVRLHRLERRLRLARFNTTSGVVDRRYFQGLPARRGGMAFWADLDRDDAGVRGDIDCCLDRVHGHALRRADDGQQQRRSGFRNVMVKNARSRSSSSSPSPRDRGHQHPSADRALRAVRRLWPVGLCRVRLEAQPGPPGELIATSTDEPDERACTVDIRQTDGRALRLRAPCAEPSSAPCCQLRESSGQADVRLHRACRRAFCAPSSGPFCIRTAGVHHARQDHHLRHHVARWRAVARASMTRDEKLRIARQLERLRVDVIEAGFASRATAISRP